MTRLWKVVLAVVPAAALLAGCSAGTSSPTSGSATVGLPPSQAASGPDGSWATVVMGHLDDPLNTFGELLYRPTCPVAATCVPGQWVLATPPGVASNGGLFAAVDSGGTLTAGFGVSLGLTFSPLATTADAGSTWATGILPAALVPVADALATSGRNRLALVSSGGGRVLASGVDLSTWSVLARRPAIVAAASRSGCPAGSADAVAMTTGGDDLVAVSCGTGRRAGVFRVGASGSAVDVTPVGPVLPGPVAGPVVVERLVATPVGLEALVVAGHGPTGRMFLATSTDGATTWAVSSPLTVGGPVRSASVDSSGTLVALVSLGNDKTAESTAPGRPWTSLAALPVGTTVVVAGPAGAYSALIPTGSTLTVDVLTSGKWTRRQVLAVPIQYGSTGAGGGGSG